MIPILIESDLLLAYIKKTDWLKPIAIKIFNKIHTGGLKGIYASTATLQEIKFWFFNRRLFVELVDALKAITRIENLEWIDISPDICLNASLLMDEYGINPFDSYHAATAIFKDKTILSTEHVFDRIRGIQRIDPREFVEDL